MRKADIAEEIFKQVGLSKNEAADIVEFVLNLLKSVLQKGESVKIAETLLFAAREPVKDEILELEKKLELPPVESLRFGRARCLRSTSIRKSASPTSSTAP
jgi:nucleoid DNA-binding protein